MPQFPSVEFTLQNKDKGDIKTGKEKKKTQRHMRSLFLFSLSSIQANKIQNTITAKTTAPSRRVTIASPAEKAETAKRRYLFPARPAQASHKAVTAKNQQVGSLSTSDDISTKRGCRA
jgi:hypothetical protein